jgi:PAS domain S-box-containing protein
MTAPAVDALDALGNALFDAYPDAVLLVEAQGRIVRANSAAATLFGATVDELLQLSVEALVPDAVRSRHVGLRDAYQHAPTRRPMGLQRELAARRRDGSEVMVEIALSPLQAAGQSYVLAAVRGIAEFPRVKQALLRARYAEQVAQLGRIAVDARDLNGLITRIPAFVAEALKCESALMVMAEGNEMRLRGGHGLLPGEAIGKTMALPPGSPAAQVMASGESVIVADLARETRFALPAAHLAAGFRSAMIVPISDQGRPVGALAVRSQQPQHFGADERATLESMASLLATTLQRLHSEEALNHAQRIEAVGQLTGGIAHDFNNLLTVIQGNLQVLEDLPSVSGDALAQDLVAAAARASRRGAELTAKLLAFSRRQVLQPRAIDVAAMLEPLAALLRRTLDTRIRIEVDVAADCPPCLVDPGQLESALLNIAINARDAMPEGGVLRFAAERCAPPADADAAAWAQGGVALRVRDSGVGMSQAVLARAFEPFFTTKEAGRGTGLGLATVHGFIHQSKGVVALDSRVGEGTVVTLYLPTPLAAGAAAGGAPATAAAPRGLSVLLVEDEPEVLRVVQTFLAQWQCRVVACANAQAALDALADAPAPFDLLISDVMLGPGLRGDQLALRLRESHPAMPVLLMSGYAGEMQTLPWPLLRKPFTREQLAEGVLRATTHSR